MRENDLWDDWNKKRGLNWEVLDKSLVLDCLKCAL